jgi:hypothetical protein
MYQGLFMAQDLSGSLMALVLLTGDSFLTRMTQVSKSSSSN